MTYSKYIDQIVDELGKTIKQLINQLKCGDLSEVVENIIYYGTRNIKGISDFSSIELQQEITKRAVNFKKSDWLKFDTEAIERFETKLMKKSQIPKIIITGVNKEMKLVEKWAKDDRSRLTSYSNIKEKSENVIKNAIKLDILSIAVSIIMEKYNGDISSADVNRLELYAETSYRYVLNQLNDKERIVLDSIMSMHDSSLFSEGKICFELSKLQTRIMELNNIQMEVSLLKEHIRSLGTKQYHNNHGMYQTYTGLSALDTAEILRVDSKEIVEIGVGKQLINKYLMLSIIRTYKEKLRAIQNNYHVDFVVSLFNERLKRYFNQELYEYSCEEKKGIHDLLTLLIQNQIIVKDFRKVKGKLQITFCPVELYEIENLTYWGVDKSSNVLA